MMMRQTLRLALTLLLGGGMLFAGCTPAEGGSSTAPRSSTDAGEAAAPHYVADAALYRGEITEVNGEVYRVEMVDGRSYGEDVLMVTIGADTLTYGIPEAGLQVGDYIEFFYGTVLESYPAQTTAIAVNYLAPSADQVVYNGVVQSAEQTDEGWNLLLVGDAAGMETLFRTGSESQIYLDETGLQPGAHLSILYNGVMTRSLPPQATAREVALYTYQRAADTPAAE